VVVTDELEAGPLLLGQGGYQPSSHGGARPLLHFRAPPRRTDLARRQALRAHLQHAEQYKVDGVISEILRNDAEYGHDKLFLDQEMKERGIPILELDVEYGKAGAGR